MENWDFAEEIKLNKIDLARAGLQIARIIAYPTANVLSSLQKIDELVARAQERINLKQSIIIKAQLLSEFLFQQQEFTGNAEQYYDVRNSFLNDVLERRLGIPISLSVLFLIIAERLNIPAYGIGLPGHFIVMVPNGNQRLFFDPFNGGGRLSLEDCARLVEKTTGYNGAFQPEWLDPISPKMILTRMLANIRGSYVQIEKWPEAIRTLECLQLLDPNDFTIVRDLGVLYFQNGEMHQALSFLNTYAKKDPEASDLPFIKNGIAKKLDEWVKLN